MTRNAVEILQSEFHLARSKILELASFFDRVERSEGDVKSDEKFKLLIAGIESILKETQSNRSEKIQLLMSRPYDSEWRKSLGLNVDP